MVDRRRQELGVRIALGAGTGAVLRSVIGRGMVLTLSGVALGTAGALAGSRVLAGLLFAVTPTDPLTYAGVGALLMGVALLASWLPARRILRLDPARTLRAE